MPSYYTEHHKRFPAVTKALLEAILAHKTKSPTQEELVVALPLFKPDNIRNMLARLQSRLVLTSHGRPKVWILTQKGHRKLEWYRAQDPALDSRPAPEPEKPPNGRNGRRLF